PCRLAFQKRLQRLAPRFAGVAEIVAVDLDDEVGEAGAAEDLDGFEDDVNALVVDKLAEEAEAVALLALLDVGLAAAVVALAVGDDLDPVPVDPPGDVMLDHEAGRRGEHVDRVEMLL